MAHRCLIDKVFQSVLIGVLEFKLVVVCEKSKQKKWCKRVFIIFADVLQASVNADTEVTKLDLP